MTALFRWAGHSTSLSTYTWWTQANFTTRTGRTVSGCHCLHSMQSRVYATVGSPSVRPSVCLSVSSKLACVCWCLWASTSTACISTPNMVRHDICRHNYAPLLLPTLLSDSQVSISFVIHTVWWTISGQVKAHVVLTCTNVVSPNHLPVIVASNRPWTTLSTRAH